MTHSELIALAERWLRTTRRHSVVLSDVRSTAVNEQPDVIGWKNSGLSTLVECKASQADFRRDAKKWFRCEEESGMGYERYYCAPAGVIGTHDLPSGWGLLIPSHRGTLTVVNVSRTFMRRNEREERRLLINAVRRVTEGWGRRVFGEIAPPIEDGDPHPTASRIIRELREENRRLRDRLRGAA